MLKKIYDFFFEEHDVIRLEMFRVALGVSMVLYFAYLTRGWRLGDEWLTDAGFHVSSTVFHVYPVAPLLPKMFLPWFGLLLFGSLSCWTLGIKTRLSGWFVLALVVYVSLADALSNYTINRMFMISLFVMACVPQGAYWSLERKHDNARSQSVWPIRVLQMVMVLHYFLAGWAKVFFGDWLKDPYVLWEQSQIIYMNGPCAWLLRTLPIGAWVWMQYMALTFELASPILFCVTRFRVIGIVWGCLLQLMIAWLMQDLIYFSVQMMCFYILFVDDRYLHMFRQYFCRSWNARQLIVP